ncbi:flavodoxin [Metabacillus iocasae]|uniref:Flavodoxin n=1 Tax=Priestia iocasae TaxID=2291674 RepID=A0ABS2QZA9_9BACI|nr:flavodoxin [Metabacillus iocasae]MBM7704820.1 flavodoxin I [Metabacillus iocasae]
MSNVLLIYASMSGNTEAIADILEEELIKENINVTRKEVFEVDVNDLNKFNYILLGAYTWGDGELPDEFLDFYDDMESISLEGKKVGVFGSGDTAYDIFCGAVDLIEARVRELSGELMTEGLKVELAPFGEDVEKCRSFAASIINAMKVHL